MGNDSVIFIMIDSTSSVVTSFFYAISRMTEEEEEEEDQLYEGMTTMSMRFIKANEWVPRITGVVTFLSSLCMLWMAWKKRDRLFHRLVLGMSLYLLIFSGFMMYGTAAIPQSEYVLGSYGNTTTCTTQGFFIYVTGSMAIFYYSSFSVYSFVGVLNNFEKEKYMWVEKYIHILVHICPFVSAFYILSQIGFTDSSHGFCFLDNGSLSCDDDPTDVPSDEQNCGKRQTLLITSIPMLLELFFPTAVMTVLVFMVAQRQENIFVNWKTVAKQAVIYLFALFWAILPFLIIDILKWSSNILTFDSAHSSFVFAVLNYSLFGLWTMLVYLFFSVEMKTRSSITKGNNNINNSRNNEENELEADMTEQEVNNVFIFGSREIETQENPSSIPTMAAPSHQPKYSFNIFDGTNASGAFADFINDGDSDDEQYDNGITEHWAAIQDHI